MKLSILISFSGAGGVEKMVMNLVREFARSQNRIDLLVLRASGPHFSDIPANVNVIQLKAKHTFTAIPEIARYLKRERPNSILVAKDRAARATVIARRLAGVNTHIVVRLGTNLSTALSYRSGVSAWLRTAPMQYIYNQVDKIVAVSQGVADDTIAITKVAPEKVMVIRNPVITNKFIDEANQAAPHPWFEDNRVPVIMGIGRFSVQKDFETLLKAFSIVAQAQDVRLIILGDGKKREELEAQIKALSLHERVLLPGFQNNVSTWLKHCDLFVLSSRWEGSPNALTEALALGIPSVSTRCPSGPDELLENGRYGPLVPMGDEVAMASAMLSVLEKPLDETTLKQAVEEYHVSLSAKKYLETLNIPNQTEANSACAG